MENLYCEVPLFCKKCGSHDFEFLESDFSEENLQSNSEKVILKCHACGQTFTASDIEEAKEQLQSEAIEMLKKYFS